VTDTPPEQPERTRFVDPPPAEPPAEPSGAETPVAEPVMEPVAEPVASAPVDIPDVPFERTQAEVPQASVERTQAEVPQAPVERARPQPTAETPAVVPAQVPPDLLASAPRATAEAPDERTHGTPGPWPTRLLAVLALLLAVGVGLLAWWAWPLTDAGETAFGHDGADALKAAKADAKLVLAYDYRDLDKGFQQAVKVTTDVDGKDCPNKVDPQNKAYDAKATCFRSEFTRTHQKVVVDFAKRYQTVVIADVSAGGVERVDGDEVTVLLYVNQQSTNNLSSTPKITQDRVEMTMKKVDGEWLVAGIRAL
jgi:Mce-associated membrane protein